MILKRQDLLGEQGNYLQEEALASLAKTTPVTVGAFPSATDMNGARLQPVIQPQKMDNAVSSREANLSPPSTAKPEVPMTSPLASPSIITQPQQTNGSTNGAGQNSPNIFNAGYSNAAAPTPQAQPISAPQPAQQPQNFNSAPQLYGNHQSPVQPAQTQTPQPTRLETKQQQGGEGRRLVVGPDISLNGEITTCDILVVEGNVQAVLKDCKQIEIAPGGTFKGNAEIENAVVAGNFEGNLVVRNRLHVMPGGKITGSVRYGIIQVDAGGEVNGDLQSLASAPRAAAPQAPANQRGPNNAPRTGGSYQGHYNPTASGF